jgi:hypothetical protein
MMKTDWTEFDKKLLARFKGYGWTCEGLVNAMRAHATPYLTKDRCVMRVIDQRLQALKRRGLIVYDKDFRTWRKA